VSGCLGVCVWCVWSVSVSARRRRGICFHTVVMMGRLASLEDVRYCVNRHGVCTSGHTEPIVLRAALHCTALPTRCSSTYTSRIKTGRVGYGI